VVGQATGGAIRRRVEDVAPYTPVQEEGAGLIIAWIALAVALVALELHHGAFYALFGAIGCVAGALVAVFLPSAIPLQILATAVVAGLGILLVRPRVSAAFGHRHEGHRARGVHGGLVGQEVVTLDLVGGREQIGHVRLAGERWMAISGADRPIPSGTTVVVTAVEGTTLIVWPSDGYLPPRLPVDGEALGSDDGDKEER
jgi:membrane protein implicated in regulation of membrane protease activity